MARGRPRGRPAAAGLEDILEIRNLQRASRVPRGLVETAARQALLAARLEGREISFALVGDRSMAALNHRFTGREGPTDVLAFPLEDADYLGEVVISVDTCRRQARERGVPFGEELALLVAHGVLHLAGYDHTGSAREKERMRRMERVVLRNLEIAAWNRGGRR